MDEDTLRSLWESTFAGVDPETADPGATYKHPGPEAPLPDISLPTFAVGGDSSALEPSGIGESTTIDSGERAGLAGVPHGDDDSVLDESAPTIYTPPPQAEAAATLLTPPPGEAAAPAQAPAGAGSYEIREVIGVGGMGVVYRAEQVSLGREVAIKKIKPSRDGGQWTRKFIGEAHVTGRLTHPNIVPVYDLGQTPEGDALIAMKLVDGVTWKRLLHPRTDAEKARAEGVDLVDHLRIFDAVCNAVAFAHSKDVIHNDLKPENILIGEYGEVLVMDWGLAMDVGAQPDARGRLPHKSEMKGPCGTPAYMAPELASADVEKIGPTTDVYLLGSILHEIVSGKPPHRGKTVREVVSRAARSQPPTFEKDVPIELRAACWKALAREPEERFADVGALQAAVREFLTHKESRTIEAAARAALTRARGLAAKGGDDEALYEAFASALAGYEQARVLWDGNEEARAGQWEARVSYAEAALARGDLGLASTQAAALRAEGEAQQAQQRLIAARVERAVKERAEAERSAAFVRKALAAAGAVIVLGLTVGTVLINAERGRAEANAARAEAERERAEGERARAQREQQKARLRLAEALVSQGDTLGPARRWGEARELYAEARSAFVETGGNPLPAELGLLDADQFSPRPLVVSDQTQGRALRGVAFLPSGRTLLAAGPKGLWSVDVDTGQVLMAKEGIGEQLHVAVCPDGSRAVSAGADGQLRFWRLPGLESLGRGEGHEGPVRKLAYSPSGRRLLSAGDDGTVRWWDPVSGELLHTYTAHTGPVVDVAFNGEVYAYSITAGGQLIWWNVIDVPGSVHGNYVREIKGGARALALRRWQHVDDMPQLSLALPDHGIAVWDHFTDFEGRLFNDFRETERLVVHTAPATALRYAPDGAHMVSGGLDGRLVLWSVQAARRVRKEAPRVRPGQPRPRFPKREVQEQTPSEVKERLCLAHPGGGVHDLAISADGRRVATAGGDGRVRLWDLGLDRQDPTGAERARDILAFPVEGGEPLTCAALSPDGLVAAAGSKGGAITLWDRRSGLPLGRVDWHGEGVVHLAFRKGGEELLSVGRGGQIRLWAVEGLTPIATTEARGGSTHADSAGDRLAVSSGQPLTFGIGVDGFLPGLTLPNPYPAPLALDPSGARVALGTPGGEVEVWTTTAPARKTASWLAAGGPRGAVAALAFAADGERVLSGGADGRLHLQRVSAPGEAGTAWRGHATAITQVLFGSEDVAHSAGADGSWRVWSLSEQRALRTYEGEAGRVTALGRSDASMLVAGEGALRLFDWSRPAAYRAFAAEDLGDPVARGRWYAFRGSLRAAVRAFERARSAGRAVPEDVLMRCHWELGHHGAAREALERATALPRHYVWLVREELDRLEALEGSRLGREPDMVHAVALTPDGRTAVSSSAEGSLRVWDLESGAQRAVLRAHARGFEGQEGGFPSVRALAVSPGGDRFASLDQRGNLLLWDLDGRLVAQTRVQELGEVRFGRDGNQLYGVGAAGKLVRWDLPGGAPEVRTIAERSLQALAISADGETLAAADGKGEVVLVELAKGAILRWRAGERGVIGLGFREGDRELVVATDKGIQVFDRAGRLLREVETHQRGRVYGFALSPDGARGVAVGDGATVFDLAGGAELYRFPSAGLLFSAALGPKGQHLLVGGRDGGLVIHRLTR